MTELRTQVEETTNATRENVSTAAVAHDQLALHLANMTSNSQSS
ncbi:hypothetical protein [Arthrobacter sp. BF1]|nr:hypothetical protein [Arthrobacter sp. BF1]